jgi:hypothetical protein
MPVVINEIEILEKPQAPASPEPAGAPPPSTPALSDAVVRLLLDRDSRQRRLVAD